MFIGIVFIASASLFVVWIIFFVGAPILDALDTWRLRRSGLKTLRDLTDDEKRFLRPYIHGGENTQYAQYSDGVVRGLDHKGVIYRASNVSMPGGGFPFNLQPYMRRLLREHTYLLD
jgi:superinfection exclusion protein B